MPINHTATDRLVDAFGRRIDYVRLSVTDRCDLRCVYCMSEKMQFLPNAQVLSLEELAEVSAALVELGVRRIRLTGGEPLVRRNLVQLVAWLGQLPGLEDLMLTTNAVRLSPLAGQLRAAGLRRVNISLDSLNPERFQRITRVGRLETVLAGIQAAREAGFDRVKLNAVIMRGRNDHEVLDLLDFARERELDISFIEEMPLGSISEHDRGEAYCSSDEVRDRIAARYPLVPSPERSAGPSRYWRMADSPIRVGFISPHSHNFCDECNRVRVTVEGRMLLCLGNEHSVDLRQVLRQHPGDRERLKASLVAAMAIKPASHHFDLDAEPQILRFMNMTGG